MRNALTFITFLGLAALASHHFARAGDGPEVRVHEIGGNVINLAQEFFAALGGDRPRVVVHEPGQGLLAVSRGFLQALANNQGARRGGMSLAMAMSRNPALREPKAVSQELALPEVSAWLREAGLGLVVPVSLLRQDAPDAGGAVLLQAEGVPLAILAEEYFAAAGIDHSVRLVPGNNGGEARFLVTLTPAGMERGAGPPIMPAIPAPRPEGPAPRGGAANPGQEPADVF